jgi:ATP-dependent Clp protease ATP-binding subunit ClpA/transcriptional regulator with XRE-family HTH domain
MESVFDSLSPCLKAALARARDVAHSLRHDTIGTDHLLFGLVAVETDIVSFLLGELGVSFSRVHKQLVPASEEEAPPPERGAEMTEYARGAISGAIARSRRSGYPAVLCGHLLRSLLDFPNSSAVKLLGLFGLDRNELATYLDAMYAVGEDGIAGVGIALDRIAVLPREEPSWHQPEDSAGGRWDCAGRFVRTARILAESSWRRHAIGTEHLLLAILHEPDWIETDVLRRTGLGEKSLSLAIRFLCSRDRQAPQLRPLWSENAIAAVDWAIASARRPQYPIAQLDPLRLARKSCKRGSLQSEQLLLGLITEGNGAAIRILEGFGLSAATLRQRLLAAQELHAIRSVVEALPPDTLWLWINRQLIRTDRSLGDLARTMGVPRSRVRAWVRGTRRPIARSCDALAAAFGADPNLVRRLAGRPELLAARDELALVDPAQIEALRAQFEQIRWDADRINRMSALFAAMLARDADFEGIVPSAD